MVITHQTNERCSTSHDKSACIEPLDPLNPQIAIANLLKPMYFAPIDPLTLAIIDDGLRAIVDESNGAWSFTQLKHMAYEMINVGSGTTLTVPDEPEEVRECSSLEDMQIHCAHQHQVRFRNVTNDASSYVADIWVGDNQIHMNLWDDQSNKAFKFVDELRARRKFLSGRNWAIDVTMLDSQGNPTRITTYCGLQLVNVQGPSLSHTSTAPLQIHIELSFESWTTVFA